MIAEYAEILPDFDEGAEALGLHLEGPLPMQGEKRRIQSQLAARTYDRRNGALSESCKRLGKTNDHRPRIRPTPLK